MKENRKIVRYKLKQNLEETVALDAQEKKISMNKISTLRAEKNSLNLIKDTIKTVYLT